LVIQERLILLFGHTKINTMKLIRKISIGQDYKNEAMHYSVGQEVYGGHKICDILEENGSYKIYIEKNGTQLPWKNFNSNMAISIEYNLDY
jgi:hypothetical protein